MSTPLLTQLEQWLAADPDPQMRDELLALQQDNPAELAARFSGRLAFGTAGLRGVVGAGPMRMNRLVVQQTTAGLGQYLLKTVPDAAKKGVVIGYDGRHDSQQFAYDAASVLTGLGIKVMLTAEVAATPLVAFGVKHLDAAAGVVVTASHNPPEYNGYKVYWGNGAQIIPPHDNGIAAEIDNATRNALPYLALEPAIEQGKLVWLDYDFYTIYQQHVAKAAELAPVKQNAAELVSIAYTAMHGVGGKMAQKILQDAGFNNVFSVAAQAEPDGSFPTVVFPNPEEKGAMDLVIAEAKKQNALLACANDPDADRFAVAVRKSAGQYQMLTGDQVGALLGYYLLKKAPANKYWVGTTIVSSTLLSKIAASVNKGCYTTLTGFKWLTNVGMEQQTATKQFLFAYEEALGYTVGDMVWDKDGLTALVAFAQLTAELAAQGLTIWDQLTLLYREHGLHLNSQVSIALQPNSSDIGACLRENPPAEIAGKPVMFVDDLSLSLRQFADGTQEEIKLPKSDVLIYQLADNYRVIVRPSGTEPKIKCYYEIVETMAIEDTLVIAEQRAQTKLSAFIEAHQASIKF